MKHSYNIFVKQKILLLWSRKTCTFWVAAAKIAGDDFLVRTITIYPFEKAYRYAFLTQDTQPAIDSHRPGRGVSTDCGNREDSDAGRIFLLLTEQRCRGGQSTGVATAVAASSSCNVTEKYYLISFAQRDVGLLRHVHTLPVDQDIDEALHAILLVEQGFPEQRIAPTEFPKDHPYGLSIGNF